MGPALENKSVPFSRNSPVGSPVSSKPIMATPDIVLKTSNEGQTTSVVIDVKYKSVDKLPDRDDLNQIISYAASYGASHGVLILPANEKNPSGLNLIGELPNIKFYTLFVDLNHADIETEESLLSSRLRGLFPDQLE